LIYTFYLIAQKVHNATLHTDTFLQHALVRDLAWVIVNPPIIQGLKQHQYWTESSDWQQAYQAFKAPLKKLDANPAELVELLAKQKDYRLGHRFETLLTYWFNHSHRYEILAQNLQIQDTNKTIGEFDFIIKDHARDKVQHWEVACKFYLGINDTAFTQSWVGPMLKDRLDLKYDSMQSRQSKLSEHPAAKQQLQQLGLTIDEHIGLMKGRLFHPIQSTEPAHPSLVASDHQHAQWARLEHFVKHFQSSRYQWQVLKKDQWMASQLYCSDNSYLDTDSIAQYFLDRSQASPLCLAGFLPETSKGHEIKRIFLVAKDWAKKSNFNDNTNSY
jgi:hypothetical protein